MLRATLRGTGKIRLGGLSTISANPLDLGSNWPLVMSDLSSPIVSYDPMFSTFLNAEAISAPVDFFSVAGRDTGKDSILTLYGNNPVQDIPEGSGVLGNFVAYVNRVKALFSDWDFDRDVIVPGEHPVVHTSLRGVINAGQRSGSLIRPTGHYTDGDFPYTGVVVDESLDGVWSVTPSYGAINHGSRTFAGNIWDLISAYPLMEMGIFAGLTPFDTSYGYSNLHVISTDAIDTVALIYDHFCGTHGVGSDPYQFLNYKRTRFRIEYSFAPLPEFYPGNGNEGTLSDYWRCSITVGAAVMFAFSRPNHDTDPDPVVDRDLSDTLEASHYDVSLTSISGSCFIASVESVDGFTDLIGYTASAGLWSDSNGEKTYQSFYHWARNATPNCFAGNYLATVDAIDKQFVVMRANHVEFLVELSDILSPLDLSKAAIELSRRGLKGSKVRALLGLINLLADAKLVYSFAIAPTLGDARDVATKLRSFRRKYFGLLTGVPVTCYGKYLYETTSDDSTKFVGTRVTCRTKIRLTIEPDSLLPYILPVRSLGLLPSLSTIWDLLPFSFVVDWLTNVGSTTRAVEDQLLLLAFKTEFSVHSVLLEYLFTEDDQSNYDFSIDGSSPAGAGYRHYSRYLLSGVPIMVPTDFGIYGNVFQPDWGLIGALLYKLS